MTRQDHRGRFTRGSIASARQHGAPLLEIARKSPAHVRGHKTRRAKRAKWVAAHIETLRRSM